MKFKIQIEKKVLIFNSELKGLKVYGKEYVGGEDGILIYDKTRDIKADEVELQTSSNTSTLIPALRILSIPYHLYFDQREVVGSQNNISFYWNKSKLAAFYNKFSTDRLDYEKRESIIKKAVNFLIKNSKNLPLKEEFLARVLEHCKLLGFYQGFPIFEAITAPTITCGVSSTVIFYNKLIYLSSQMPNKKRVNLLLYLVALVFLNYANYPS